MAAVPPDSRPTVSMFAVDNVAGRDLAEEVVQLLDEHTNVSAPVVKYHATAKEFKTACMNDDVVVFDGSIEEEHNYAAATAQPTVLEHVLVVSRTCLPINFFGIREGGAPGFVTKTGEPGSRENRDILDWLNRQLFGADGNVPGLLTGGRRRPAQEKGPLGHIRAMKRSIDDNGARSAARGRIFISYRSRYYDEPPAARDDPRGVSARTLAERLSGARGDENSHPVRILPPGELLYSDEILSEQRHWLYASTIDRMLGSADDLWVYGSPDYLESWWTRAELMAISYHLAAFNSAPQVHVYDPIADASREPPPGFVPAMSHEQYRRMVRWYSNGDPGTMAPESALALRTMGQLPLLRRIRYFRDHAWSHEFWDDPLLPCPECRPTDGDAPDLGDVDAFLWLRWPGLHRVTSDALQGAAERGQIDCPHCGAGVPVYEGPPRYLWMPTPFQRSTGPGGSSVVELPVYRTGC